MRGKWKTCLIHNIRNGLRRPSELHRMVPSATPRALNLQLSELEAHDSVRKAICPILPPKIEYVLTPEDESMLPIVDTMKAWGGQYGDAFQVRLDALTLEEVSV